MDLKHSKTMESNVSSEVYNIPDSKSTDLIQPRTNEGLTTATAATEGAQKGEQKPLIIPPITSPIRTNRPLHCEYPLSS